jgi:alkylation response protein AidB-like acyl-CoA dehydrogenase
MLAFAMPRAEAEVIDTWRVAALQGARLLHRDAIGSAFEAARRGGGADPGVLTRAAVASVYAVETCAEMVSDLFRYGGGRVLALSRPMQRHLRDVLAARQHVAVTEEHYETAGRELIESARADGA